jgi:homocysteine S-methyltransferase
MARYRDDLPQLGDTPYLTDGGIETTLIFDDGLDLPDFAAFTLLDDEQGRSALDRYFDSYASIASRDGVGIVLETPTWRASNDWGERLGYGPEQIADANRRSVDLLVAVRDRHESDRTPVVISGCVGPRGDGYDPGEVMSSDEAGSYHAFQIRALDEADVDLVTAITMTNTPEAIGIVQAAEAASMPVVISFTVETDGRLPTGETLSAAIEEVDVATGSYSSYFMINCAHPTHFDGSLEPGEPWNERIRGLRANASRMSHAELDEAAELDRGDPDELAASYAELLRTHPHLRVLGGCCGTSHLHIDAISQACLASSG